MRALLKLLLLHVLTGLGRNALGAKIIHGVKVPENAMRYMVSLQDATGNHFCGGFLIREDFVLTAAHCDNGNPIRVVLGTHDLKRVDDEKIRLIEKKYIHKHYESVGQGKDIMLLKLSKKAPISNSVQTIQLPSSPRNLKENEKCLVAGWGKTKTNGQVVDELREVNVSIINLRVCVEKWNGLPEKVFCAGGYNTNYGFCWGDSGGPLVCNGQPVGIVSFNWDFDCDYNSNTQNKPNVYTDVSKYLPWINDILRHG
ncbi:mast cell protease 2-like [Sparus aurata]|uniref:Mast cell protease 2-like n=1 Tax=Sparus aurata TaxID=8175 RepID=A0A671VTF9_SPAAU|nr:mast cell protease 2-like [Sparus aurata]